MTNKLILEYNFSNHQKTHILISIGSIPIVILLYLFLSGNWYKNLRVIFFSILVYVFLLCFAFTKKGVYEKNRKLYKGLFFNKNIIIGKYFDLNHKSKISTLRYKKNQKMAWFSMAKPDLQNNFNSFDLVLLNNNHTEKTLLISLKKKENSIYLKDFLLEKFSLVHEVYSPNFT